MATNPKDDGAKTPDSKPTTDQPKAVAPVGSEGDIKSNAADMVGYRDGQVGAREAALAANEQVAKEQAEALKNATPADQVQFSNPFNQVPQEGALVETPPQPVPPSYSDAELKEMDHAPAGLREPSVAKDSTDTDQTVHPESRVNDPSKPL